MICSHGSFQIIYRPLVSCLEVVMEQDGVIWSTVSGTMKCRRRLSLKLDETGIVRCPVNDCRHDGFRSVRGARKHITNKHPCYFHFDEFSILQISNENNVHSTAEMMKKAEGRGISTAHIPSFTIETGLGKEFVDWIVQHVELV